MYVHLNKEAKVEAALKTAAACAAIKSRHVDEEFFFHSLIDTECYFQYLRIF